MKGAGKLQYFSEQSVVFLDFLYYSYKSPALLSYIYISLLALAFFCIQILLGGIRPVYTLAACLPLGIAAVVSAVSILRRRVAADRLCLLSASLFFGFVLFRAAISPVHYLARADFFAVLAAMLVYFLTALCVTRPRQRLLFVSSLLLLAAISVLLGVVQFARSDNFMLFGLARPDVGPCASGLFAAPNHLAGFLQVIALFSLGIVCWSPWKSWAKVLVSYVTLGCIIGILLTGSLGGYLSSFAGLIVFLGLGLFVMWRLSREQFPAAIILSIAMISVLLLAGISFSSTQASRARAGDNSSGYLHLYLWDAALQQATVKPITGTGSGTFPFYARHFRSPQAQADVRHAHNDYVELLAEYGPVGVLTFLFFLYAHLTHGLKSLLWLVDQRLRHAGKSRSYSLALAVGALSSVAACATYAMVDSTLHVPSNALMMSFVAGLLANLGVENSLQTQRDEKLNRVFACGLPVLGVVMLILALPQLPGAYFAERARAAMQAGDFSGSIEYAGRALSFERHDADIYYRLGEAKLALAGVTSNPLLKRAWYNDARKAFEGGLAVFSKDARLLLAHARNLDALGRAGESGGIFEEAVQLDPNSSRVRACYGLHLEQLHMLDRSKDEYKRALKLDPANEFALQRLQEVEAELIAEGSPEASTAPEAIGEGPSEAVGALTKGDLNTGDR